MSTEITKFDPAQIAEGLKDKIRAEVANLIPDVVLKQMIESVTNEFINGRRSNNYSQDMVFDGNTLRGIVTEQIKQRLIKATVTELDKPEWQVKFDNAGRQMAGDAMRQCIVENADALLVQLMSAVTATAVQQMRFQLEQAIRNG